jgi:hypothetical protein
MGFNNLSGNLTAYIEEQSFPLITKALIGGRTASMLTPQLGVKGKTKINLMDVAVNMQDGAGCSFAQDGDITYTQREIDAKNVKINMEFCPRELEGYYLRTQLSAGASYETIPFEEQFANYLVEKVQDEIEKIIWGGNASTGAGNLRRFDGLLIPAATLATDCNGTSGSFGTALTGSLNIQNVLEAVERIYVETPSAAVAQGDFTMFMGTDKFRTLAAAIMNGNGGASLMGATVATTGTIDQSSVDPLRIVMPGTNIDIVGVGGLEGFNAVYGFSLGNAFLGMDLADDSSSLEMWYSQDDRKFKVAMEFTMGTQFAYPDQVGKVAI